MKYCAMISQRTWGTGTALVKRPRKGCTYEIHPIPKALKLLR